MHGHSLLFVPAFAFIGVTQVAELALRSILATDNFPEEGTWLASALEVQHRPLAVRLGSNKLRKRQRSGRHHLALWRSTCPDHGLFRLGRCLCSTFVDRRRRFHGSQILPLCCLTTSSRTRPSASASLEALQKSELQDWHVEESVPNAPIAWRRQAPLITTEVACASAARSRAAAPCRSAAPITLDIALLAGIPIGCTSEGAFFDW